MAKIYTSTMILAVGGFLKGEGLGVSSEFESAVEKFQTTGITGNFNTAIADATTAGDLELVGTLQSAKAALPFLSGEVVAQAVEKANAPFSRGVAGFINNFSQVGAFGATAYEFSGAVAQASSMSFSDFGGKTQGYGDVITGGVSAQFPNLNGIAASIDSISKLGGVDQLTSLASSGGLVNNILDAGFGNYGGVAEKLEEAGLSPDDLSDPAAQETIRRVLDTVTGPDLQKILSGLGLPDTGKVTSLSDAMDPGKIMPAMSGVSLPTAAQLANSIQDIGGNFKDLSSMAGFLRSIEVPSFPHLANLKVPIPDDLKPLLAQFLGTGSGPFGNPTMLDMLGSAAGHSHTAALSTISSVQSQLASSPTGAALNQAIASGNIAAISAAMSSITGSGNSDLLAIVDKGNSAINDMAAQLETERKNLEIAKYQEIDFEPAASSIVSFAAGLHGMGVDSMELNTGQILETLATDDLYGDAVKATMIEGRNRVSLAKAGTMNTSFMDANSQKLSPYKYTKDADLTYSGDDNVVYDRINAERANRGLAPLSNPRPPD